MPELTIGGFVPFSATDYPDRLCAVVFCQGCPWRCVYCHNPHLQARTADEPTSWRSVAAFLGRRQGLLDAVVFSGGEPLLQDRLPVAAREARDLGFLVGLHSGGAYPERLARLLPLVDWVGFDVKADFDGYDGVTGAPSSGRRARESLDALLASGVAFEVRTTVHPRLISRDGLMRLAESLARLGVANYAVQAFRAQGCADRELAATGREPLLDDVLVAELRAIFPGIAIRR